MYDSDLSSGLLGGNYIILYNLEMIMAGFWQDLKEGCR